MIAARRFRRAAGAFVLATAVLVTGQVHAAEDPGPAVSRAESTVTPVQVESLIARLRNDTAREELIVELEALLEASSAAAPDDPGPAATIPDSLGAATLTFLAAKMEALNRLVDEVGHHLDDLPRWVDELGDRVSDSEVRSRWLDIVAKLVLIVGLAFVAEWLVVRSLRRYGFGSRDREPRNPWLRLALLLRQTLIEIAPVGAFGLTAYAVLSLAGPQYETHVLALVIVNANILTRAITVVARTVLRPRYASLRFVSLSDETAHSLFFWARCLAAVAVYGFLFTDALHLLGLRPAPYAFLHQLVGLVTVTLVVTFVLRNRHPVRSWLRARRPPAGARHHLWGALADTWHLLAIAYITAVYVVWAVELAGGFEFLIRATITTLATVVAAGLALAGIRRAVARGFRLNEGTRHRFPHLEARVNRYRGVVEISLRAIVVAIALVVVLDGWGLPASAWIWSESGRLLLGRLVTISVISAGALLAWETLSTLIERYLDERSEQGERGARMRTFLPLVRKVVRFVLVALVVLVALSEFGIDITPLLASVGIVGLAVSFGAQSLVKDVFTGFFILVEDSISVGDVVDLGGHFGVVESMSIRSVRLRDLSGSVYTIPFGEVATVINTTKDFSYALMDVGVAYREDVDEVISTLREIADAMRADEVFGSRILDPLHVLGLDSFGNSSVNIRIRLKTLPSKQWGVKREFQRRMKRVFDERGIDIPFPSQTIYFGVDKAGEAPAARVRVAGEASASFTEPTGRPGDESRESKT